MTNSGYEIEGVEPRETVAHEASDGVRTAAPASPLFARDKFLLHQKRLAISEKYSVFDEQGNQIMFVHR